MEWRPIDSAPKDGTRILLTYPRPDHAKRTWGTVRIGKWRAAAWHLDMNGHSRVDCTHWMPLPDAPDECGGR